MNNLNNLVLFNVKKLRDTIDIYVSKKANDEVTYSYVLRKIFGVSSSTLSEAVHRVNKMSVYNPTQDTYGYLTKSMYSRLKEGFNSVIAPELGYPRSYFSKNFLPKRYEYYVIKNTEKETNDTIEKHTAELKDTTTKSAVVENKTALNSIYGIGIHTDKQVSSRRTKLLQVEIGKTSNLITNMIIQGASEEEILTAVKYSRYLLDFDKLCEEMQGLRPLIIELWNNLKTENDLYSDNYRYLLDFNKLSEKIQELHKKYYCAKKV